MKNYCEDSLIYCDHCMQSKEAVDFKIWLTDRSKARYCDSCIANTRSDDAPIAKYQSKNSKCWKKQTKSGAERMKTRRRIEDIKENMEIEKEFEL